jgi:tetratricopeptide (TPR) repeat protein
LPIQVDLSAMVDGELDPAGVRRVLVHADQCAQCRQFLDGVRMQVRLHRAVEASAPAEAPTAPPALAGLRDLLATSRRKLARVLYELGRGHVLMGLSPEYSREVAKEPVPVPDMAQRGRNLLDEAARAGGAAGDWVAAKDLFDGVACTAAASLDKGARLLRECLALDDGCHEARIYLGLAQHAAGRAPAARREFQRVLARAEDRRTRGFALLNLGNLMLEQGDADGAVDLLLQVVESGAIADQPQLGAAYFNLGLAHGLARRFAESAGWFRRMAAEMPHKQAWMRRELQQRSEFVAMLRTDPAARIVADAVSGLAGGATFS